MHIPTAANNSSASQFFSTAAHHQPATMAARGTKREVARLSNRENDWNLDGSGADLGRTRGGAVGHKRKAASSSSSSSDEEWKDEVGDDDEEEEDEEDEEAMQLLLTEKPSHERVVLEVAHVIAAIEQFSKCPECNEPLKVDLDTVCIATSISIACNNPKCSFITYRPGRLAQTTMHAGDNYERMTDYAINVLYVIGFISMGDAHTEAGRLLGLAGLPNDTTMKSRSFAMIEERIGPFLRDLCDNIITENMTEEVRLSLIADNNLAYFEQWKKALTDESIELDPLEFPKVDASYDMAWQQKGSGHQYNSMSGHGSMFGSRTRKIIGLVIKSKMCCYCNASKKKAPQLPVAPHNCWKNHDGSSGSMESAGCVELVVEAFDKRHVIISKLCCNDDSSIRADCRWSNADT
jgi:hypothetical protein